MINRKFLILGLFSLLLVGLPVLIFLTQQRQETRSQAAASTIIYLAPTSTLSSPIQKTVGETVSFDVMIDPGNNLPTFVLLDIRYDQNRFEPLVESSFSKNAQAFPITVEGPIVNTGNYLISLSIGSDPTKAIKNVTKIGTLTLKASSPGTSPAVVSFGPSSQVLSLAATDNASEDVLSSTQPGYVNIVGGATLTPTLQPTLAPTSIPTPTSKPSPTPTTAVSPTVSITPSPLLTGGANKLKLSLSVFLHGIGTSGDNANPTGSTLSNKNPLHPTRSIDIKVFNAQNQLAAAGSGNVSYASASGNFKGIVEVQGATPTGFYVISIKEATHLRRRVSGIQELVIGQTNTLPSTTLIAGDTNNDNKLNILDYNLIIGCYSDLKPAVSCTAETKLLTDLNDDGNVNQFDYNLFIRELTVQSGD